MITLAQYLEMEQRLARNAKQRTAPALDSVVPYSAEQTATRPLENRPKKREGSASGVRYRVALVAFRRRLLDPDAVAFSCKPATDAIANWLGVDDADPRVEWEWTQVKSCGRQGVLVKIEIYEK
jgi:hypothetical protein